MRLEKTVSAAVIKDRKIFLVNRGKVWELPQGNPTSNECDTHFLKRRFFEWFNGTFLKDDFDYLGEFKDKKVKCYVFFAYLDEPVRGTLRKEWKTAWVGYDERKNYKMNELNRRILDSIHENGRI